VNEHNAPIPRDFWLEEWEREAIIRFCIDNPLEGYRLTFMMLDQNIVAVSPTSVWRVLSKAGLLEKWCYPRSITDPFTAEELTHLPVVI
jgi:putative transposase